MIDGVNSVDLRSLMSTPTSTNVTGNGSSNLKKINDMSLHSQISILCDLVSLTEVEINAYFVSRQNIDDGWRGIDTQCKEYTFSRSDPNSRNYCKIPGETKIGPVKDVRVVKIAEIHGTEIEVPSIQNRSDTSWVVITRGPCHQFHFASTTSQLKGGGCFREGLRKLRETAYQLDRIQFSSSRTQRAMDCDSKSSIVFWRISFKRNINVSVKIAASFWSRWKRIGWSSALRHDSTKIAERIRERRCREVYAVRMAWTHFQSE